MEKCKVYYENMEEVRREKDRAVKQGLDTYERVSTMADQIDTLNREITNQKGLVESKMKDAKKYKQSYLKMRFILSSLNQKGYEPDLVRPIVNKYLSSK